MEAQVVYFSAEFGIDASLPVYSGGLGVLAGDFMKAANDLGLPMAGVGILYKRGYFEQHILPDGRQEDVYPPLNLSEGACVETVTTTDGEPLFVQVPIQNRVVYLKVWRASVGHIPVYLLDADIEYNQPTDRRLTDRLYGGNQAERICHEIILGIGGVRALRAVGINPTIWHLNEGHAAFSGLERIREYSALGLSFEAAVEAVKATTVFTTHTPVPAGHDVFPFSLVDEYLGHMYWQLGAARDDVIALGSAHDAFNMTRLAVRLASKVNGVSQLHAHVTRQLFHQWAPQAAHDMSVESITNGVHVQTWLSPNLKQLFDEHLDADWSNRICDTSVWSPVAGIPDEPLWRAHQQAKCRLIARFVLPVDENTLLIGFARRFATYKRATLIFRDLDRLDRITNHPDYPVRFVFAGKAHPSDRAAQDMLQRVVEVSRMEKFRHRISILQNYDLNMSQYLVQGVDVWLNTPVRPMEASGTSGQKAGLNGVLNCSVLDGWWYEGYNGSNGWAVEGSTDDNPERRDAIDSNVFYSLLETKIAPSYYDRPDGGQPHAWIAMMKESIRSIAPTYSAHRMVQEYWNQLYTPLMKDLGLG